MTALRPPSGHWDECWKATGHHDCAIRRVEQLGAELELVRGAVRASDERLRVAGERVGVAMGCDTAEEMADMIVALRAELTQRDKHVAELEADNARLRMVATEPQLCALNHIETLEADNARLQAQLVTTEEGNE